MRTTTESSLIILLLKITQLVPNKATPTRNNLLLFQGQVECFIHQRGIDLGIGLWFALILPIISRYNRLMRSRLCSLRLPVMIMIWFMIRLRNLRPSQMGSRGRRASQSSSSSALRFTRWRLLNWANILPSNNRFQLVFKIWSLHFSIVKTRTLSWQSARCNRLSLALITKFKAFWRHELAFPSRCQFSKIKCERRSRTESRFWKIQVSQKNYRSSITSSTITRRA